LDEHLFENYSDFSYTAHLEENELPITPPSHPLAWDEAQETFEKWQIFRIFPLLDQLK
jgi:hypothetical protein